MAARIDGKEWKVRHVGIYIHDLKFKFALNYSVDPFPFRSLHEESDAWKRFHNLPVPLALWIRWCLQYIALISYIRSIPMSIPSFSGNDNRAHLVL